MGVLLWAGMAFARTFGKGPYISEELPPVRPVTVPAFNASVPGEYSGMSLDEPWQFIQYLYDADTARQGYQQYLNAVPVQFGYVRATGIFLATIHTVFETTNGGRTWYNLDPFPPPDTQSSDWSVMRAPMYISGLAARPVQRPLIWSDTLLVSAYSSDADSASVRHLYYLGGYHLYPFRDLFTAVWITGIVVPDSVTAIVLAGLDGRLWENDLLQSRFAWREVNTIKAFIRTGRQDSLVPNQTWVSGCTSIGNNVIAVGSHHWISEDDGHTWHIRAAADSLFDTCVSFCDSLHGMVGGGTTSPTSHGWVHVTTNGGNTWSGRVLQGPVPVRAVEMVTPQIGFAAGGNYQQGVGRLWSTTDGGQTWSLDMQLGAEIRALKAVRVSNAYVNVFAAGVFPDFRGGMWRTQLYLPDSSRALLVTDPDTLDFGVQAAGLPDTLTTIIRNIGSQTDTIMGIAGTDNHFTTLWGSDTVAMPPGQEHPLQVVFMSDSGGTFTRDLTLQDVYSGRVEIFCTASVPLNTSPRSGAPVPQRPVLTVWPNPGNASFEIRYEVARESDLSLRVYDLNGRLVETLSETHVSPGEHMRIWNAADHASGIYFVRLDAEGGAVTRKVLLIK